MRLSKDAWVDEVHAGHHRVREAAEEGAGLPSVHREGDRREDRHGFHGTGPRSDYFSTGVHGGDSHDQAWRENRESQMILLKSRARGSLPGNPDARGTEHKGLSLEGATWRETDDRPQS